MQIVNFVNYMTTQIGFKIKTARRKLGMNQLELAKTLNISPSYLNLIESGKRKVSVDLLIKASEELNLDLTKLSSKNDAGLLHDLQDLLGDMDAECVWVNKGKVSTFCMRVVNWTKEIFDLVVYSLKLCLDVFRHFLLLDHTNQLPLFFFQRRRKIRNQLKGLLYYFLILGL